jgi:hypothetical protein
LRCYAARIVEDSPVRAVDAFVDELDFMALGFDLPSRRPTLLNGFAFWSPSTIDAIELRCVSEGFRRRLDAIFESGPGTAIQ